MSRLKKLKNKVKIFACFLILCIGFCLNLPVQTTVDGFSDFDWWSESLLVSDLIYYQNYEATSVFTYGVSPETICPDDWTKAQGVVTEHFINDKAFEQEMFGNYTSNLVVQHFFFRLMDSLLPVSNTNLLRILHLLNCTLLAAACTAILWWLGKLTSMNIAVAISVLLAVCAPMLTMYGENLYWCAWTLYLPMIGTIGVLCSRSGFLLATKRRQWMILACTAFVGCAVKQAFYFEFVSVTMIAMTVPLFYWMTEKGKSFREQIYLLSAQIVGAVLSFAVILTIKSALLASEIGFENGLESTWQRIAVRLWGQADGDTALAESTQASYGQVILMMLDKPIFSLKYIGRLTALGLILLTVAVIAVYITSHRQTFMKDRKMKALVVATGISLLAPLSWFVLAKPHTYIHNQHCSVLWFCPFVLMAAALVINTGIEIFHMISDDQAKKYDTRGKR